MRGELATARRGGWAQKNFPQTVDTAPGYTDYIYRLFTVQQSTGSAMDDNKQKALGAALSQIERQFGKGSIMRMGEQERVAVPVISSGSLTLDIALGVGGLPRRKIIEIY